MDTSSPHHRRSALTFVVASIAALAIGLAAAIALIWTNDDAYISFRYAEHLIHGMGLVFNPGERVEGYTNFLWTLWCALGMRFGAAPETWANTSGIGCFGATIAFLVALTWSRRGQEWLPLPIAALALALHRDAAIFATGGLETPLFTLLIVAGCAVLTTGPPTERRAALAAVAFGLATLTRPDGVVPTALAGLWLVWDARSRPSVVAAYVALLAIVVLPWIVWKVGYYGELLPNTYFAKSANRAWWSQGTYYVGLFFAKYAALAVGLAAGLLAWIRLALRATPDERDAEPGAALARRQLSLALLVSVGFIVYVARVGGDFMFARFLVPVTPLMLVALEIGIEWLVPAGAERVAVAALALLAIAFARNPIEATHHPHGIVNERAWYPASERHAKRRAAESFAAIAQGLPVRVAFYGAEAIHAYYTRAPVAIEAEAGLTDRFIARQPLAKRGRVGHEKSAPWSYLVRTRRAHFALLDFTDDSLAAHLPIVLGKVGDMPVVVLTWDPPVMEALRRRGARFEDFPARLDSLIARLPSMPDSVVRVEYERIRPFYFEVAADSTREAPFRARLAAGSE
jgi:hypothetical protein